MSFDNLVGAGASPTGMGYANEAKMLRMPTLADRLDAAVKAAEDQLADAKEARELLNRNPDLERLLNIMQKGRF